MNKYRSYRKSDSGRSKTTLMIVLVVGAALVLAASLKERLPLQQVATSHAEEQKQSNSSLYSYRDSDGRQHFVDDEAKIPEQFRDVARERDDLPKIGKVPAAPAAPPTKRFIQRAKVRVLVASWCGYCRKLEQFLQRAGIRYEKLDVENNSRGRDLYEQYGAGGIPVTLVDDEVIRGFQPDAIMNAIRAKSPSLNAT